jgi:hypothetical protein
MNLLEMNLSNGESILVEVSGDSSSKDNPFEETSKATDLINKIDEAFDKAVQNVIVQNALILVNAFKQMESHPIPPNKATAEFGLKLSGKGTVYVVETSAVATFKISIEWLPSGAKK